MLYCDDVRYLLGRMRPRKDEINRKDRLKATQNALEDLAIVDSSLPCATSIATGEKEKGEKRHRATSIRAPRGVDDSMPSSNLQRP